jgi:hypothetical protein
MTIAADGESKPCEGCGLRVPSGRGAAVPLAGAFCSIACVETELFGGSRCRWCGAKVEKAYSSVDSRLCSEDCSANYYAHVAPFGSDRSASLGTGKRLALWLVARESAAKTLVRGRPRKNGHAMSTAERVREFRRRNVTKINAPSLLPRRGRNVTLQVIENKEEPNAENRV